MRFIVLISISFRNLLRQKRRNALLGAGIGFGMLVLVLAHSFAEGISDIIINNFLADLTGHIEVSTYERSSITADMIRNKAFFIDLIKDNVPDAKQIEEGAILWCRAIGNGKGETMILTGISTERVIGQTATFISTPVEGKLNHFEHSPTNAMIYESKAKDLGLTIGDTLQVRLQGISGQMEVLDLK